jgi:hypothetical protein
MAQAEEEAVGRGRAGASARAEYERRQTRDESRRRAVFGPLAPVVPAHRPSEVVHRGLGPRRRR